MKSFWIGILTFWVGLVSNAQQPSTDLFDMIGEAKARLFLKSANFTENSNYADYDLVYQRMEWEINPSIKYISGAVTSYFVGKKSNLDTVSFDLHQTLQVDSVLCRDRKLVFQHQNHRVDITLEKSIGFSEIDSLAIFYHGIPDGSGFGSFVQSNHNGVPIIWTLSEPYGALDWWPCKQSLSDKIDSTDILVTCPELYRTASIGILADEKVNSGQRTMFWKHRYPVATYLVAIAVTNYSVYTDTLITDNGGVIPILNYVFPENLETAKQGTRQTIDIMSLYNRIFGLYPFSKEKYGHAQFGWGGGMEHQTMSFMGSFGFDLVAHELSHQWFGDYITLASWHDIWLNEGFATFVTGLAYENLLEGVWWPQWRSSLVNQITSLPDGSVYVQDTSDVSRIFNGRLSYSKGGYLLHTLRWVLGDEHFFNAVNNYLEDPDIANDFATQEKLVYHLQNEADTILAEFFNDWYYGEGYPVYSAQFAQSSDGILKITLFQETSHASVDFFEMPVQVRCYNAGKTDSIDFRLEHTFSGQDFFVEPGFNVGGIKIDPELWLISKTGSIVSVPWIKNPKEIFIYPNPVTDYLNLVFPYDQVISEINLITTTGKKIQTYYGKLNKINLANLPNGTYFIQAKTTSGTINQKFLKQ